LVLRFVLTHFPTVSVWYSRLGAFRMVPGFRGRMGSIRCFWFLFYRGYGHKARLVCNSENPVVVGGGGYFGWGILEYFWSMARLP